MPTVRLPGGKFQRPKTQAHESYRTQEVHAGARYPPFEVPGMLDAVVTELPFMIGIHRYVRSFALTVLDMLGFSTIRSAAEYLGVGWDLVKNIHKERLQFLYRKIPLKEVKVIGIDEFSFKEGHHYMTVITELDTDRVLHAVEGKGKEDIKPFMETREKAQSRSHGHEQRLLLGCP